MADVLGYFRNPTLPLSMCTICWSCSDAHNGHAYTLGATWYFRLRD